MASPKTRNGAETVRWGVALPSGKEHERLLSFPQPSTTPLRRTPNRGETRIPALHSAPFPPQLYHMVTGPVIEQHEKHEEHEEHDQHELL